jgi:hypothetical protein
MERNSNWYRVVDGWLVGCDAMTMVAQQKSNEQEKRAKTKPITAL